MAATARGLGDEQVAQLRGDLLAGRAPRVRIAGTQFGDDATGTVRAVGDPAVDGDDFITVRVKINGVTDDLRFAPRELSRGGRSSAKSASRAPAKPARPGPREPAERAQPAAAAASTPTASKPAARGRRSTARATAPDPVATPPSAAARKPRKGSRRATPSAPVTVVFTSVEASWTVSAQRGSRSVVKNAPVNPGVVSAVAAMLDLPVLEDAIGAVNDTARADAETRAEQLRAELAQIQAVLDSHRRP